ncbi:hypothetical protein [Actinomadura kijaniata]|uniref:hypothetical protein n=1 Tax=Actinomadura kijaniata TaxID=46161 RepID=UPI0008301ACE|nr:hypothetical protein [Actinomadura kijaniata]
MFVQIIQGRITDAAALRAAIDRWVAELAPGAPGWLGATVGVTEDGSLFNLARFATPEDARRNSDRPEQGRWWEEVSRLFDGEPVFHDCERAETWLDGGSDGAGFVQVIQSRVRDFDGLVARMREQAVPQLRALRPDVIGGLMCPHGDGGLTEVVYFASEKEAREGEGRTPPPEAQAEIEALTRFYEGDLTYLDLRDPWLYSP